MRFPVYALVDFVSGKLFTDENHKIKLFLDPDQAVAFILLQGEAKLVRVQAFAFCVTQADKPFAFQESGNRGLLHFDVDETDYKTSDMIDLVDERDNDYLDDRQLARQDDWDFVEICYPVPPEAIDKAVAESIEFLGPDEALDALAVYIAEKKLTERFLAWRSEQYKETTK